MTNLPAGAAIVPGAYRLVPGQRRRGALANFDVPGAVLATGGMPPLVYALVKAPGQGWGAVRFSMPAPELTGQASPAQHTHPGDTATMTAATTPQLEPTRPQPRS